MSDLTLCFSACLQHCLLPTEVTETVCWADNCLVMALYPKLNPPCSLKDLLYLQSGLYAFVCIQSLSPGQKLMCDLPDPTISNYKGFPWQGRLRGQAALPVSVMEHSQRTAVSEGSCTQGPHHTSWPKLFTVFLVEVP